MKFLLPMMSLLAAAAIAASGLSPARSGDGPPDAQDFSLARVAPPWDASRPSIYRYLEPFAAQKDGLTEAQLALPDDAVYAAAAMNGIRWAPGAIDGLFTHHVSSLADPERVEIVYAALLAFLDNPGADSLAAFYAPVIAETTVLDVVDGLKEKIYADQPDNAELLHDLAYWLATESPDRNAVKLGIALLGMFVTRYNTELLTLGMHDEFTLYAMVALATTNPAERAEDLIFGLVRRVHGWGRIFAVERLAGTGRRDIRNWLVREGYKNNIMTEYTAYECAVTGHLLDDLRALAVYGGPRAADRDLITGAGEILTALLREGPVEGMAQYADGVAAIEQFLPYLETAGTGDPRVFLYASDIGNFTVDPDQDWEKLEAIGWTPEKRTAILERAEAVTKRPEWRGILLAMLEDIKGDAFLSAAAAADRLGLDTWPFRFRRLEATAGNDWDGAWLELMDTGDADRVAAVLRLAGDTLDWEAVAGHAGGEADSSSLVTMFDAVLHGLNAHPGEGWRFVEAGLRSPVPRYRRSAVGCLAEWGKLNWPPEAEAELRRALGREKEEEVEKEMRAVLEP